MFWPGSVSGSGLRGIMAARVVRIVKKAASMSTLVALTLGAGAGARWLGTRPEGRAEQLWAGPGAVERFAERARSKGTDQDGQRKPPLIQQAEAFAAYLNPPAPRKPAAAPVLVRPRPVRAEVTVPPPPPPLRLLGVSYHRGDPAESRALVLDANGYRWVKQGGRSGEMVVAQINPRSIVCRGKGGMQEMTMETEPGSVAGRRGSALKIKDSGCLPDRLGAGGEHGQTFADRVRGARVPQGGAALGPSPAPTGGQDRRRSGQAASGHAVTCILRADPTR
jgi:hypothetical protein